MTDITATPDTFEDRFAALYGEAFELLVARQRKYGPANIERLGIHGVLSRLAFDKVERVMRALNGSVVNGRVIVDVDLSGEAGDTFEDALLDIANYALIALALGRGLWAAPLRSAQGLPEAHLRLVVGAAIPEAQGDCPVCHADLRLSTVQRDGVWCLTRWCSGCGYEDDDITPQGRAAASSDAQTHARAA